MLSTATEGNIIESMSVSAEVLIKTDTMSAFGLQTEIYLLVISSCFPALMQRVQILIRPPPIAFGSAAHWRLGYLRWFPDGLNLVARMRFE